MPSGHVAHFIVKLIEEELNFHKIESVYEAELRGAPPFSPRMMTGVLIYGYMRGVYSSRELARACEERVDFMMLSAMNRPDFRTIALFRSRHAEALKDIFTQVVRLCLTSKLIDFKHVAVDGTKIKANASKDKNQSYQRLKEQEEALVKEWLTKSEELDAAEDQEYGDDDRGDMFSDAQEALKRIQEAKKALEERDKQEREKRARLAESGAKPRSHAKKRSEPKDTDRYNFTDPDSRLLRTRQGFVQGYNGQAAVDSKNQIIVSCHLSNAGNDLDELKPLLKGIEKNCVRLPKEISADTGYCSEENLAELQERQIRGYVALGQDPPKEKQPIPANSLRQEMKQRFMKGGKKSRYRLRKITVEPVFGIIKQVRKLRELLLRGLQLAELEWSLVCTSHNLWKLFRAS